MTVALSQFSPLVAPEVPGCPAQIIANKILKSAISFCEGTGAWIYEHADISTVAGTRSYAFVPPTGGVVDSILEAFYNGEPLLPKSIMDLQEIYPSGWRSEQDTPLYYLRLVETSLDLAPKPSAVGTISLLVTCKPALTATVVEDFLYNSHADTIAAGAKALLMAMPGQRWTNPGLMAFNQSEFDSGVASARLSVSTGKVGAVLRVKPCV
jgi:hypothetical protein